MDPTVAGAVIGGILAIGGGLLGGLITGWYTLRANKQSLEHESQREERERQLAFRREQLEHFYGPALACMEELEECWNLLFAADKNVENFLARNRHDKSSEQMRLSKKNALQQYKQHLYGREVEVFGKVKETFVRYFGLAEPSTKDCYRAVVRFIENRNLIRVTERELDITFTGEDASGVREKLGHLFEDLIILNREIRRQIEAGEPRYIPMAELVASYEASGEQTRNAVFSETFSAEPDSKTDLAAASTKLQKPTLSHAPETTGSNIKAWPGRYTGLIDKSTLEKYRSDIPEKAPVD